MKVVIMVVVQSRLITSHLNSTRAICRPLNGHVELVQSGCRWKACKLETNGKICYVPIAEEAQVANRSVVLYIKLPTRILTRMAEDQVCPIRECQLVAQGS
jgi:hypothetical protein